jgi:hypothetical protein
METCVGPLFSIRDEARTSAHAAARRSWGAWPGSRDLIIPREISAAVTPGILLSWVEAELERFVPAIAARPSVTSEAVERFRDLFNLVCFAYALGITRSTEIVEACTREREFRMLAATFRPFADELKSFRRRYRPIIEAVLTRIFLRAALWHGEFDRDIAAAKLEEQCANIARGLLNLARHLDSCDEC